MCRNIRVLHHFEPPTTDDEIHAAALQYVRKVSGQNAPLAVDRDAFEQAVTAITLQTKALIRSLSPRGAVRTRDGEKEKARLRWRARESRLSRGT